MTTELKQYVEENIKTFRALIGANEQLQPGMNLLKPILPEFIKENPSVNLTGACKECLLDVLRWAIKESKEEAVVEKKTKK